MPITKMIQRRVTPSALSKRETTMGPISPGRQSSVTYDTVETDTSRFRSRSQPTHSRGLTGRTSRGHDEHRAEQDELKKRWETIAFIEDSFKRKECHYFVKQKPKPPKDGKPSKPQPDICMCGGKFENHHKHTKGTDEHISGHSAAENDLGEGKPGAEWNKSYIREIVTNAFGEINFINEMTGGHKPAKFLRLSDTSDIEEVMTLMTHFWNMNYPKEPNLVITVIGGAKNFKLDGKKKEVFNRGLVEAAQSTHAWIITSGCNMGVMKAVGEAVEEGQTYEWDRFGYTHTLRCIGIAPWGYVERNHLLTHKNSTMESWLKTYTANNKIVAAQPVSLNPNHTHFLLVDDGMRGKYQGVAVFRAALESELAKRGKHVVLVVVEGGTDAILDTSKSLKRNIPVVLCEGTGRAADILAFAYTYSVARKKSSANGGDVTKQRMASHHHDDQLEEYLLNAYGKTWEDRSNVEKELAIYKDLVLECCESKHLISVFDMNKDDAMDVAVLAALLKGQGASEKDTDQLYEQLMLALTWNRSDVAEEKIFNKDINWPEGKLHPVMMQALRENRVNFVKLLLNNGVIMKEIINAGVLRKLYNANTNNHLFMYNMLKAQGKKKVTLKDVHHLLQKLHFRYTNPIYELDEHGAQDHVNNKRFEEPFRELFVWAVLTNRQEMAKFLWERGDLCISSALAASQIYFSMADRVEQFDLDLKDNFLQNKEEFEHLAVKVLDECHYTHPENAAELLERRCAMWEDMNCLEMAAQAQDKEFLSSVACQKVLDSAWNRGINVHWAKLGFCIICPPLIWWVVEFENIDEKSSLSPWLKLATFYRAPVVKFASNMIMYLIFLITYCYMLLFAYGETISVLEIILLVWIFTLVLEEMREMFFLSKADNIFERIQVWWNFSNFNRIDLLIILVSLLAFMLRINGEYGQYVGAKTVYCINCILFFVRVLSFYTASSYLGPKLVMIARMVQELMLYILILVVFLIAYGVTTLALQYPSRKPYWLVLRDIFYYPYWQIYGELFLEELEGRTDSCEFANGTMSDGNPCPQFNWLVPALTALYLLIGNVLLLNLLIAIFTNVFEEVNTNSIQIWKFGMYFLVVEYEVKPSLAPPFVIFEHIILGIRWLGIHCSCAKTDAVEHHTQQQRELLDIFEREMQKAYLMRSASQETDSIELKINKIHHRVDEVTKLLKEEQLMSHQLSEKSQKDNRPGLLRRPTSMALIRSDSEMSLLDHHNPYGGQMVDSSRPSTTEPSHHHNLAPIPELASDKDSNLLTSDTNSKTEPKFKNLLDTSNDPYAAYNFTKPDGAQMESDKKAVKEPIRVQLPPVNPQNAAEVAQAVHIVDSDNEKPRRKVKKKKRTKSHDIEPEDDESFDDLRHISAAQKPPPRPYVTPRGLDSRAATSSDGFTARESHPVESDIERRLTDMEGRQTQLDNIEVLLRGMMFQSRGQPLPVRATPASPSLGRVSANPAHGRAPQARMAFDRQTPTSDRDISPPGRAYYPPRPAAAGFENPAFQRQEAGVYTTGLPLGGGVRRPNTASQGSQDWNDRRY